MRFILTLLVFVGFAFGESVVVVEGITCSGCVKAVKKALKSIEGVEEVKYEGEGKFVVKSEKGLDEEVVKKAISKAGYKFKSLKEVEDE